jgi:hypothetical protein
VTLPGVYAPAGLALRVSGALKPPLRDKAVVLKEACLSRKFILCSYLEENILGGELFVFALSVKHNGPQKYI